jgi:type IV secretory pathway component VirB8
MERRNNYIRTFIKKKKKSTKEQDKNYCHIMHPPKKNIPTNLYVRRNCLVLNIHFFRRERHILISIRDVP